MASHLLRSTALLGFYIAFMIYAFVFAPGSLLDISSIRTTLFGDEEGRNPLFAALFSMLMPVGFGIFALISAGASAQKTLSTELFGSLGSFLGFYGSGAYLALREHAPKVSQENIRQSSWIVRFMEHWVAGAAILVYSMRIYISLMLRVQAKGFGFAEFATLVRTDRYVFATLLDLVVLTVVGIDPLMEDMRRRGWRFDWTRRNDSAFTAVSILSVPGAGLGMYVMLRPKLK